MKRENDPKLALIIIFILAGIVNIAFLDELTIRTTVNGHEYRLIGKTFIHSAKCQNPEHKQ